MFRKVKKCVKTIQNRQKEEEEEENVSIWCTLVSLIVGYSSDKKNKLPSCPVSNTKTDKTTNRRMASSSDVSNTTDNDNMLATYKNIFKAHLQPLEAELKNAIYEKRNCPKINGLVFGKQESVNKHGEIRVSYNRLPKYGPIKGKGFKSGQSVTLTLQTTGGSKRKGGQNQNKQKKPHVVATIHKVNSKQGWKFYLAF